MNDIQTPNDIHWLVSAFYKRVRKDRMLGPVFDGIARVNWKHHLPVMMSFWEALLLRSDRYRRNSLQPHLMLFKKIEYCPQLMERWLMLFYCTVDEYFVGETADKAKHYAESIAHNLQKQINRHAASKV